jgi:hypothetical protein
LIATQTGQIFKKSVLTEIPESTKRNLNTFEIYPNPGNDLINISFNQDLPGQVKISLFNELGQELVILKDEWMDSG